MNLATLPTTDPNTSLLNVVIEVPRGTRNKWKHDDRASLFRLSKVLPPGAVFPFDFGFLPSTKAEDGDPLDILVLTEEPTLVGGVLPVRLLGVIEAEQTQDGKTTRNDRLVGVVETPYNHPSERELADVSTTLLASIEHFFVSYNEAEGRTFKPLERRGVEQARRLIDQGERRFKAG